MNQIECGQHDGGDDDRAKERRHNVDRVNDLRSDLFLRAYILLSLLGGQTLHLFLRARIIRNLFFDDGAPSDSLADDCACREAQDNADQDRQDPRWALRDRFERRLRVEKRSENAADRADWCGSWLRSDCCSDHVLFLHSRTSWNDLTSNTQAGPKSYIA